MDEVSSGTFASGLLAASLSCRLGGPLDFGSEDVEAALV